jgi:8-oxo-dGTP diphosphatase
VKGTYVMEIETWQKPHMAMLAADVVLFARDANRSLPHVLLIKREDNPDFAYAGCWALPGGLVDVDQGETFEVAARRELTEETGITAPAELTEVGTYGDPDRDSRGRVVSVAFATELPEMVQPTAGDDAAHAKWVPWLDVMNGSVELAFDHRRIVEDARYALERNTAIVTELQSVKTFLKARQDEAVQNNGGSVRRLTEFGRGVEAAFNHSIGYLQTRIAWLRTGAGAGGDSDD